MSKEMLEVRTKMEAARSSMTDVTSRNTVLDALMKMKAKGQEPFTGVAGRLGDLGAIPEKYDIAISTACTQLDYIVTDTVATAQACVKYLHDNKLGRATFIMLDKVEKDRHKLKGFKAPPNRCVIAFAQQ